VTLSAVRDIDAPIADEAGRAAYFGSGRARLLSIVGLSALLLGALALRLEGIGTWYWIDESLSVGLAQHGLTSIPSLLLRDGSPPLWYLVLHVWMGVFGSSVVATHALSLAFALLTVPVSWFVARRLFGPRAAWLTGALAAFNPFVTYFAHETRMYSLAVLLAVVVAGSFVEAFVDEGRRARWVFVASLVALLYTHNWGLYTAFACLIALVPIVAVTDDRGALVRRAALAFVVVGACYAPWLPALASQIHNTGAPWSFTPSLRDVARELAALFRDERVLVALALGTGVGLSSLVPRWRTRDGIAVASLVTLFGVPVAIGWVISHIEPSWATRYLAVVVGPLLLLVGCGLARAGAAGIGAVAIAALLVLQPITRLNGLPMPRDAKSNARDIAAQVGPRLAPGDLVVVAQPEAVPLFRAELGGGFTYADPTGLADAPTLMDWRNAEDRLRAATFADLAPLIDRLKVGQRLAVIAPGNEARDTDTTWIQLFRTSSRRTVRALRTDPRFTVVDRIRGDSSPYVTFDAVLFERVTK
jgi:hypothetical protein